MVNEAKLGLRAAENFAAEMMGRYGADFTRMAIGAVFVWFGALKFFPGCCDLDVLAQQVMGMLTLHLVPVNVLLIVLATVECLIGAGLVTGKMPRTTLIALFLHLGGTLLPLLLLPGQTWKHFPYAPSFAGQYILKNFILMGAASMIGANAFVRTRVVGFKPARLQIVSGMGAVPN